MKKALLTTIILFTLAMTATAQQELFVPTAASDGLKGPVYVVQTTRWYTYGNQDVYPYTSTDVYGRDGLKMYNTYISEVGYCETVLYGKDEQGRLTSIYYDGNEYGSHYIYSNDGRLRYICSDGYDTVYRNDTTLWVTAYDKQGHTLEISDKDKPLYRYKYRSDGSLLSAERLDCWTIYYNLQGQIDSISGDHKIVYNKYGDEAECIYYRHGTEQYNYGSDRDQYGNWLSMDFVRDSTHYYVRRQIIYYDEETIQEHPVWTKAVIIAIAVILLFIIGRILINRKNR